MARLAFVLLIIMELVNQINSKYQLNKIEKSIESICKNDHSANLLGFKSKQSSSGLCKFIINSQQSNLKP